MKIHKWRFVNTPKSLSSLLDGVCPVLGKALRKRINIIMRHTINECTLTIIRWNSLLLKKTKILYQQEVL